MGLFECCHPWSRKGTPDDEGREGHNSLGRCPGLLRRCDEPRGHGGNCWALVVGNSAEWDRDRDAIGDVGLCRALVDRGGVPPDQVVFLRDADATAANARVELDRMLSRIDEGDVFLLYYGGHGEPEHFCTHRGGSDGGSKNIDDDDDDGGGFWRHEEVADAMDRHFRGRTAWLLLDCCHSGNFYRTLQRRREQAVLGCSGTKSDAGTEWVCVMSTEADAEAGDEWTLTECFVRAIMEGRKSPVASTTIAPGAGGLTDVERFLGHASDEIARVKGDLMTVYVHYPRESVGMDGEDGRLRCDDAPFLPPLGKADKESPWPLHWLGRREKGANHPVRLACSTNDGEESSHWQRRPWMSEMWWSVGDEVYAKWRGGKPTSLSSNSDCPFLLPLWFPATVVSTGGGRVGGQGGDQGRDDADVSVEVEFNDPMLNLRWRDHISDGRRHLLPKAHFSRWTESDYDACIDAQIVLAERLQFVTYFLPVGTACSVLWEDDGIEYDATIASARDVPWDKVVVATDNGGAGTFGAASGAFVAVHWDEEGTYSVVPLKHCAWKDAHDGKREALADCAWKDAHDGKREASDDGLADFVAVRDRIVARKAETAAQALLLGLDSSGKSLIPAASLFGETLALEGFWGGTGEWFDAHSVDKLEQPLPLRALASHVWYTDHGDYCAVRWDEDGTISLLPRKLVRKVE